MFSNLSRSFYLVLTTLIALQVLHEHDRKTLKSCFIKQVRACNETEPK